MKFFRPTWEGFLFAPKALYVGESSGEGIKNREIDEKRKFHKFLWILARMWAVPGRIWVEPDLKWCLGSVLAGGTPVLENLKVSKSAAPDQGFPVLRKIQSRFELTR